MNPEHATPDRQSSPVCPSCRSSKCKSAAWAWTYFDREDPPDPPDWTANDPSPKAIARRCAKPMSQSPGRVLTILAFAVGLALAYLVVKRTSSTWLAVGAFVLADVLIYVAWHALVGKDRVRKHEAELQEWNSSFLCMACGHMFVSSEDAA